MSLPVASALPSSGVGDRSLSLESGRSGTLTAAKPRVFSGRITSKGYFTTRSALFRARLPYRRSFCEIVSEAQRSELQLVPLPPPLLHAVPSESKAALPLRAKARIFHAGVSSDAKDTVHDEVHSARSIERRAAVAGAIPWMLGHLRMLTGRRRIRRKCSRSRGDCSSLACSLSRAFCV
ncbi:hypothetical protein R3P38DRAFT_3215519 [Favolaschia claudopus]|uniref:Uncharacterized protein n=1 Tax=Favolaschia claudopus TaxID=2862362 RepID=A0AAW0A902_9AGAR